MNIGANIGEVVATIVVVILAWVWGKLLWESARGPWEELHNAVKHCRRLATKGETDG